MKNHLLWAAVIAAVVKTVLVLSLLGLVALALIKYIKS